MKKFFVFLVFFVFLFLTFLFYFTPLHIATDSASMFLTVSTFIFAIIIGFFIARQNNRHNDIRSVISEFDGNMSALYRNFEVFGDRTYQDAGRIIKKHYGKILRTKQWNWHFLHKSNTIQDLNNLLIKKSGKKKYPTLITEVINSMTHSLDTLQITRKRMVSLNVERMPKTEWLLTILLAGVLLVSLWLIPTHGQTVASLIKGVFGALIIQMVLLLYGLDNLALFEGVLGESSARDILHIIEGKR